MWEYTKDKKQIKFDKDSDFYMKSQDNVFRPDDGKAHELRNKDVLKLCRDWGPLKSVIDIGPRTGIGEEISKQYGATSYVGLDISPRSVEFGTTMGRNLILGDAHELSLCVDEKFDTCISIHMLEHCHQPRVVLKEVWKVLEFGGRFGLRVPIQKDLTVQRNKDGLYGKMPPHFSVFTHEKLTKWMESAGFKMKYNSVTDNGKEIIMVGVKI